LLADSRHPAAPPCFISYRITHETKKVKTLDAFGLWCAEIANPSGWFLAPRPPLQISENPI
ncbi:MAG: hypothetical protein ACLVAH_10680, partial [Anaeromassilibacillus sp.]